MTFIAYLTHFRLISTQSKIPTEFPQAHGDSSQSPYPSHTHTHGNPMGITIPTAALVCSISYCRSVANVGASVLYQFSRVTISSRICSSISRRRETRDATMLLLLLLHCGRRDAEVFGGLRTAIRRYPQFLFSACARTPTIVSGLVV